MNLKKAKYLRKLASSLTMTKETTYAVIDHRVMKFVDGKQINLLKQQVIVHPQCARGIYLSFKKGIKNDIL